LAFLPNVERAWVKTKMAAELEDLLVLLATIMRTNGTENSGRSGKSEEKVMSRKVLPFFPETFRWDEPFHLFFLRNRFFSYKR